jgi:hypothetical protein
MLTKAYREQLNSVEAYREFVGLSTIRYDSGLSNDAISSTQIQMYPAEALPRITILAASSRSSIFIAL